MSRFAHRSTRRLLAALLLVVAAGCGSDATAPESPSIAGKWKGTGALGTVRFEATFTQEGETVGGTGQVSSPLGSTNFVIAGTLQGRDVQLVLTSTEYGATAFAGRFTGANTISGQLQNPDLALTLVRDD